MVQVGGYFRHPKVQNVMTIQQLEANWSKFLAKERRIELLKTKVKARIGKSQDKIYALDRKKRDLELNPRLNVYHWLGIARELNATAVGAVENAIVVFVNGGWKRPTYKESDWDNPILVDVE